MRKARSTCRSLAARGFGVVGVVSALAGPAYAADAGFQGSVAEQTRVFFRSPAFPDQSSEPAQPTFVVDAKLSLEDLPWGVDCYVSPYYRHDSVDGGRRLFDAQSSKCRVRGDDLSLSIGYDVEPWGVLEFANPSDVLNQRDITEDIVTKRRLGQPMVRLTLNTDIGSFTAYGLTFFTPLSFPGARGRLRPALVIEGDRAEYESKRERLEPEAAFRYTETFGPIHVGAAYYYGYHRDPSFGVGVDAGGRPYLYPVYALVHQASLELQTTLDSLLLKAEGAQRWDEQLNPASSAIGAGFEYDFGAALGEGQTISVFGEYVYDTRERTLIVPFTNDVFGGIRLALNDVRSTELSVWADVALPDRILQVAAADVSTRLLEGLKGSVGVRVLTRRGAFADLGKDDYLHVRLHAFF